jgi:hypothetical protein
MNKFLMVVGAALLFAISANSFVQHSAGFMRNESLYDTKTVTTTTGMWWWKSESVSQVPLAPGGMDSARLGLAIFGMIAALFVLGVVVAHFPGVITGEVKVQAILPPMPKRKAKQEAAPEGVAALNNQDLREPEYARG